MNSFGLEADDRAAIQSILAAHSEVESAVLYGSRATGRFKPGSDVDLVLTGNNLTDQIVLDIRTEFRDSNVPYMIDVVAEKDIRDENLKQEIDAAGKVFYMQIPTEHDWQNYITLDEIGAKERFFGKTLEEAEELFVDNALCYQEDIFWMHSIPFRYYVHAYMNYLLSNRSEGDTDGASCFLGLLEFRIENGGELDKDDLRAAWSRIRVTIDHIRRNPDWFEWDEQFYGNLEGRTTRLLGWHG